MSDLVDRLSDFDVTQDGWELCLEAATEIKRLRRVATDRQYMMDAYKAMLGPIASQVVKQWEDKGVTRHHTYWGPEAYLMTGEDRAKALLDAQSAMGAPLDFNDSNLPTRDFLDPIPST